MTSRALVNPKKSKWKVQKLIMTKVPIIAIFAHAKGYMTLDFSQFYKVGIFYSVTKRHPLLRVKYRKILK